jgi:hypothetical protein
MSVLSLHIFIDLRQASFPDSSGESPEKLVKMMDKTSLYANFFAFHLQRAKLKKVGYWKPAIKF